MSLTVFTLMMITAPTAPTSSAASSAHLALWARCKENPDEFPRDELVAACTAIIQSDEESVENRAIAFTNRGVGYYKLSDRQRAIADFDEAIRLNPKYARAFSHRGLVHVFLDEPTLASADFAEAIRLDPNDGQAFANRGFSYFRMGDHSRALADFAEAIRLDPNDALTFGTRGSMYARMEDYPRAIADFDRAIRLKPNYLGAIWQRGDAHARRGEHRLASADYDRIVAMNPQSGAFRHLACWERAAYLGTDLERARADCDKAISLERDSQSLAARAMVSLKQKRFQDAWNDYDEAARADGTHASYFYGRGIAERELGRIAESQADIARAKALTPGIAETFAGFGVAP